MPRRRPSSEEEYAPRIPVQEQLLIDLLPELRWRYGYALFWLAVFCVVAGLLLVMRRAKIL